MRSWQADIREFMAIPGQAMPPTPCLPVEEYDTLVALHKVQAELHVLVEGLKSVKGLAAFRSRLMIEETAETLQGFADGDLVAVTDGLADDLYVTIGTAISFGIDLGPVFDAVHAANMKKYPPCENCAGQGTVQGLDHDGRLKCPACRGFGRIAIRDAQGKVQKPPGWAPPDIAAVLIAQGWVPPSGPMPPAAPVNADYVVTYAIPDLSEPPFDEIGMVRQIMEEALFDASDFTGWTWKRIDLAGPAWELTLLPVVNPRQPRRLAVLEKAVVAEEDPDKALILAWRYRGRKKETMRGFEALHRARSAP